MDYKHKTLAPDAEYYNFIANSSDLRTRDDEGDVIVVISPNGDGTFGMGMSSGLGPISELSEQAKARMLKQAAEHALSQ